MKVHHLNCGTMHPVTRSGVRMPCPASGDRQRSGPRRRRIRRRRLRRPEGPGRTGPVRHPTRIQVRRGRGQPARPAGLPPRGRPPHRAHPPRHRPRRRRGGLSATRSFTSPPRKPSRRSPAPTRAEKVRYGRQQWVKDRDVVEHSPDGEAWRGFSAAKELAEIAPGIVLVSLPGHTRGHACVAVDAGHRWVLHCGDAFYHYGTLDGTHVPRTLWAMETAGRLRSKEDVGQPRSPLRALPERRSRTCSSRPRTTASCSSAPRPPPNITG